MAVQVKYVWGAEAVADAVIKGLNESCVPGEIPHVVRIVDLARRHAHAAVSAGRLRRLIAIRQRRLPAVRRPRPRCRPTRPREHRARAATGCRAPPEDEPPGDDDVGSGVVLCRVRGLMALRELQG
jgi:hypothetical protein